MAKFTRGSFDKDPQIELQEAWQGIFLLFQERCQIPNIIVRLFEQSFYCRDGTLYLEIGIHYSLNFSISVIK